MNNEKLYAIIDGASEEELMPMLAKLDPPAACLYAPPVQPDLVDIAPYVVLVTEEVQEWLDTRETPWGVYISTDEDLKNIRKHLRKYLYVLLPDSDQPVFFRFYDPRNIWDFLAVLSDWELHSFMGPIVKISTRYEEEEKERDFAEQRAPFPMDSISTASILALSADQYEQIQNKKHDDYVELLGELIEEWHLETISNRETLSDDLPTVYTLHYHKTSASNPTEEDEKTSIDYGSYARQVVNYLSTNDIIDNRSIKGIAQLFAAQERFDISRLPEHVTAQIERTDQPGFFKAEKLLIDELGYIPD